MGRWRDDSFSRNGYGGTKQDEIGRTIFERVDKLFHSRWMLLCPFDVVEQPVRDLYMYGMTLEERRAWVLLSGTESFAKSISRQCFFDIVNKEAKYYIRVYTSEPVVRWPVPWENLPVQVMEKLHHWMLQSRAYRDEYHEISNKVKTLMRLCTTPGQIERVWPQLMGFMPDETKIARLDKKARSPYPDGVLGWSVTPPGGEIVLKEEWREETLAWYDTPIAEALILPQYEHPDGAPAYPSIHEIDESSLHSV